MLQSLRVSHWGFLLWVSASACLNVGSQADALSGNQSDPTNTGSVPAAIVVDANTPNVLPAAPETPEPTPPTASPNTTPLVPALVPVTGLNRYTLVGRFDTSNPNAIPFTFSSSKIGVRFTGTSIAIDVASTNNDGFNVHLDGNALPPLMFSPAATARYVVAANLPAGLHTLWLSKRTEFEQGGTNTLTLADMVVDANSTFMTPPPAKSRRIECMGDSGFAGYGVEGLFITGDPTHPPCNFDTVIQNGDLSIPARVAAACDAELTNVSWSGKGIVASQYDGNPNHMLPLVYPQLKGNDTKKIYDFKTPMDVVILGGGANDFIGNAGSGTVADVPLFIQTYVNWIKTIRSKYPRAFILATVGASAKADDRTRMLQYLQTIVTQAAGSGATADPNVIMFDWFANDPNGWTNYGDVAEKGKFNWGCNSHPSIGGSQWLADRLSPVIKAHMGW